MLEINSISKKFGDTVVLDNLSFKVEDGQFVTLLGSSGCGKTTTLRIIAGLDNPNCGTVSLDGEDITNMQPNKRDINTVFQSYALFPHMNIENNIGYSLKIKGVKKAEIKSRVKEMIELVQLEGFEKRMPDQLSGGQKQRVAIARSLIARPKVLLLDEPLGALDLQLRRQMQIELKRLQKKLGISFIYITHDQEEAINMSDVIAVMRNGNFEQIGTPSEIYDKPKTSYVASFVGNSNIIKGVAEVEGDFVKVNTTSGVFKVKKDDYFVNDNDVVTVAVRAEFIGIEKNLGENTETHLIGTVTDKSFTAGMLRTTVKIGDSEVVSSRHGINSDISVGESVLVKFDPQNAVLVEDNR